MPPKDRAEDDKRLTENKTITSGNVTYIVEAGTPVSDEQAIEKNAVYYNDNVAKLNDRPLTVRVNTGVIENADAAAETSRRIDASGTPSYASDAIEIHVSTKVYSVNEWGSIMGHEMVHAVDLNDNFIFRGNSVYRSEVKAYQWQIDNSSHFNNPFSVDYLSQKRNHYQGL